jgi:hypothetical protein
MSARDENMGQPLDAPMRPDSAAEQGQGESQVGAPPPALDRNDDRSWLSHVIPPVLL